MQDTLNVFGIFSFLFSLILFFYILRTKSGPLIICGWLGLFVYSIPSFINRARNLTYPMGEEYYMDVPNIESKFIYLLFWLGFGFSLFFKNFNNKKEAYFNYEINNSLNIFVNLSFFYLFIIIFCFFLGYDLNKFIFIIGKWFCLFIIIGSILQKKKLIIFFFVILTLIYSLLVADRTIIIILLSFVFASFISENLHKKKTYQNFLKFIFISFIIIITIIISIVFTKYLSVLIQTGKGLSIESMLKIFLNLDTSFEPLIIYGHTLFAIDDFKDFSTIKYLISIFSNLTLYPSFFGLSSNYYNISLMEYLPHYTFGIAGSIMAANYLAFGYLGIFITGYVYGLLLKIGDFALKFKHKSSTILLSTICLIMAIYIHRNALDNFFAIVRQVIILFIFIKFQELFIRFVIKNNQKI